MTGQQQQQQQQQHVNSNNQQHLEDLIKNVEQQHEQYVRGLRNLHDALGIRRRERADSRPIVHDTMTPPLRSLTFASDIINQQFLLPRVRRDTRDTLDAPERPSFCPSPLFRPLPLTPTPNDGDFAIPGDDDLCFIPLLDQSCPVRPSVVDDAASVVTHVRQALTPMSFSDDMLLRHLRDSDFFTDETVGLLDEDIMRRRWDTDLAQPFRDFAAFEREHYVSSTFEVYEVAEDASAVKMSLDVDVQGMPKYTGDGPLESPDGIIDAPTVWETIKDVNPTGRSVGRITFVLPIFYLYQ